MIIAVNTRLLWNDIAKEHISLRLITEMVIRFPQHRFILIGEEKKLSRFTSFSNVQLLFTKPLKPASIHWRYWLNFRLPVMLRKYKAELLVQMDSACSMNTSISQFLFVYGAGMLEHPSFYPKPVARFMKTWLPASLRKADCIFTFSDGMMQSLVSRLGINENKVHVVKDIAGEYFTPVDWPVKESVKEKFSGGREYFLYSGPVTAGHNLIGLLKAFTHFKKHLKSNLQLLLLTDESEDLNKLRQQLGTYKFRDDVNLLTGISEKDAALIAASAYAFIDVCLEETVCSGVQASINCHIPVIASGNAPIKSIAGDAALYADPESPVDIAEKMILLYKDENLRNRLIGHCRQLAEQTEAISNSSVFGSCFPKSGL